jgi:hypothetical protein
MVRPDLTPPSGGSNVKSFSEYLDAAKTTTRVGTLFGEKNKEGNPYADLPAWFTRTGLLTFEVETGFGIVKCRVPGHKAQKTLEAADEAVDAAVNLPQTQKDREVRIAHAEEARTAARTSFTLRLMAELPSGWVNESEPITALNLTTGAPLPQPTAVLAQPVEVHKEFLAILPPSLAGQVWAGYTFLGLPPIAYDASRVTDPS